jgi:hypothetical protein
MMEAGNHTMNIEEKNKVTRKFNPDGTIVMESLQHMQKRSFRYIMEHKYDDIQAPKNLHCEIQSNAGIRRIMEAGESTMS